MKHLGLILVLGVALCQKDDDQKKEWMDEERFGKSQDAWQSIKRYLNSTYYLTNATYNNDDVWGRNFTCVFIKGYNVSEDKKSINATIRFKNSSSIALRTSLETLTAVKMYNYTIENAVKYETQGETNESFVDALVFSAENACNIFYAPKAIGSNGNITGGYELWVTEQFVNYVPACCYFSFKYLTMGMPMYTIWNRSCDNTYNASVAA
ncbi:male-specific histamine-binding salivary protein-like [Rhipicephalus sanguineus]|uniref:male-specific histamine-binding salivary protein-like n=1 Tax=Rhipicephalus sanguineus TaxID=34632 RepID=UPI001895C60D|nr:male-specific histamine-binding salivary protein-like [Rhipicephalus sanguineus]